MDLGTTNEQINKAIKKIDSRGATRMPNETKKKSLVTPVDPHSKVRRRLIRKQSQLEVEERISIIHSVICDGEFYKDVAKRY